MRKMTWLIVALLLVPGMAFAKGGPTQLDAVVRAGMARTAARGIAVAVIDRGKVVSVDAWGVRNAKGDPLTTATVIYGASLTKAVFAYTVMQLVEEKKLDLDASIATYLKKPLPDYAGQGDRYADWTALRGDERWRMLTPRILLQHASGFANFGYLEPDHKLRFHFAPGSRYAYSGDGIMLLQFVIEQGLCLDLGKEMQRRVFDRFGMTSTSMTWRADFAANLADGWTDDGTVAPHDERSKARAAGSMDTTLADFARFAAGFMHADGLRRATRADMIRPQLPITTARQFPTLLPELPPAARVPDLSAGLGVVTFAGPQGPGFYKGGHNDSTGNTWVCLERGSRCVVILSSDVRAEAMFPAIVHDVLGDTGMHWAWEYGQHDWTAEHHGIKP